MKAIIQVAPLFAIILWLGSVAASGQAVSVISSGQSARDCSMAAIQVSQGLPADRQALGECDWALEHDLLGRRDLAATYINRGIMLMAVNKLGESIRDFNRAVSIMPVLAEAYVGRGNAVFLNGEPGLAADDYSRALELDLHEAHIGNYNLGLAYEKLGNLPQAQQHFQLALDLQPGWELASEKLAAVTARLQTTATP